MRGSGRFILLIFFFAGVNLGVERVIMAKLAFDSWLREERRESVFDANALVEGDEAEDVKSEVGCCQQMIPLPLFLDEILNRWLFTVCSKKSPAVATPTMRGR